MKTTFETTLKTVLEEYDYQENPFFCALADTMSKEAFVRTQEQFFYAVVHFSSPLALCAAAIPTYQERVKIIKNLWEEHGEGNMQLTHGETFMEFLRRLTRKEASIPEAGEAVILFNETLDGVCKNSQFLKSVAMIGIIERMFADISSFIGNTIVRRGWMKKEEMIHYSLHQELDCIHAEDFFSILRPYFARAEEQKLITEGLRLGAMTFLLLYQNLETGARRV